MNGDDIAARIKTDIEHRLEMIEQELARCEGYTWELGRTHNTLEQEQAQLLVTLDNLQEIDRMYMYSIVE